MLKRTLSCLVVLVALLTAALFLLGASGQSSNKSLTTQDVNQIMNADYGYPDIAADVNGDSITGKALSVAVAQLQGSSSASADAVAPAALGNLIREQLLLQDAKALGVWPSSQELDAAVKDYQSNYDKLPSGSAQQQSVKQTLSLAGVDSSDIASSDLYRQAIERVVAQGAVRSYVRASLPEAEQSDPVAVAKAEDDLVNSLWSQAKIQSFVPITPQIPQTGQLLTEN